MNNSEQTMQTVCQLIDWVNAELDPPPSSVSKYNSIMSIFRASLTNITDDYRRQQGGGKLPLYLMEQQL